ncbi:hypothetical protein AB0O75_26230 [Streptomyces sp. NPDC088921]|uniref:hypothetical protein n=1 Tax=unclassified Streptomyces TaxID=2593676 RepID=UPI00341956A7
MKALKPPAVSAGLSRPSVGGHRTHRGYGASEGRGAAGDEGTDGLVARITRAGGGSAGPRGGRRALAEFTDPVETIVPFERQPAALRSA